MTFDDALKSNPTFYDVPNGLVELAFVNRGVESTDDYTATTDQKKSLELVSADLYVEMATHPDFREGDLSLKYNRDILMKRARNIYARYGDPKLEETGGNISLKIKTRNA